MNPLKNRECALAESNKQYRVLKRLIFHACRRRDRPRERVGEDSPRDASACQGSPSEVCIASASRVRFGCLLSASTMAAMCSGVVPQHPPIMVAPASLANTAYCAISAGLP